MRVPANRVKVLKSLDGKVTPDGYLVIEIKGLDIEGVNRLAIDMADVDNARKGGGDAEDAGARARKLLGG